MNAPVRPSLPPMPARIARLPRDHRGFPVPWFVQWYCDGKPAERGTGEPDFRVIDTPKIGAAHNRKLCWICGVPRGVHLAFNIGPMCAVNRTISEPPSHLDCAEFSAKACPFLSQPRMRRNEKDLPPDNLDAAGLGLKRNPGVACIWVTRSYKPFRPQIGNPGVLFELGEPERVLWICEGREATRAEVWGSIESGLPSLQELADAEGNGAPEALRTYIDRAMPLLPAEVVGDTGGAP